VTIPTAVVREGRMRRLITAIAVPTECRRSALGDGPEDAPMLPGHPRVVRLQKRSPCWRTMSATSKGGRVTAGASAASAARCLAPKGVSASRLDGDPQQVSLTTVAMVARRVVRGRRGRREY
jgi:hypothetical protein